MQIGGIRLGACAALAALAVFGTGLSAPAHAHPAPAAARAGWTAPTVTRAPGTAGSAVSARLTGADGLAGAVARPVADRAAPAITGKAAYLFDAATGTAYFGKQAGRRLPVASLTKVMTAYVVLRQASLDAVVRIDASDVRHARANDATSAGLRAGERLTVRDLLYGVMLPSGADASHALARVYGPGAARFTARMNAAARALGLSLTRYANPDGLPEPGGGYSTAIDQAKLARVALNDPVLRTIASTRRHVVRASKLHRAHTWTNSNKLLGKTPGALGVKTGYTRAAGYCLSFAADRDGRLLIGVVLGESSSDRRFRSADRLLDWAAGQAAEPPDLGAGVVRNL
ncbi:D-alanyl-D-alanine carboxypeptidase family protein [Streptosporangium sandarakinum]|uniref:D-alanyl-D-alanine carboxypeptidase family protein n=1 Tax=Streptosporangium sandarakinum TaxID=1260955 RepID=UPI0037909707